ncbi:MAG TPA: response regulator [Anaerolineae bacterium]|nr:response regulator [Anaerolineae bacterium]
MPFALVVDDDLSNRTVLQEVLKLADYTIHVAKNGQEGLTALEQQTYDLAFVDMHMPDMLGIKVVDAIRQQSDSTFIVFATMDDSQEAFHGAYNAGSDVFLVKPYEIAQVLAIAKNPERGQRWVADRHGLRPYLAT